MNSGSPHQGQGSWGVWLRAVPRAFQTEGAPVCGRQPRREPERRGCLGAAVAGARTGSGEWGVPQGIISPGSLIREGAGHAAWYNPFPVFNLSSNCDGKGSHKVPYPDFLKLPLSGCSRGPGRFQSRWGNRNIGTLDLFSSDYPRRPTSPLIQATGTDHCRPQPCLCLPNCSCCWISL